MVWVEVPTTLIVSHIPNIAVAITRRNPKLTNESFSLNPKYPITKFLNLKLIFHATKTHKETNTIIRVLNR